MSFFNSEVVRAEMTEIQELQEEVYGNVFKFPSHDQQNLNEYIKFSVCQLIFLGD